MNQSALAIDDDLCFLEEAAEAFDVDALPPWPVLVVDDDPDVHGATRLALDGLKVDGRGFACVSASSAQDAREILLARDDIAVILLDVVMETERAGLDLVRFIREDLGNAALRIILRTGQPGYAPEIDAIRLYQINDYKTKSELTRVRLFTSLAVAVRSYQQVMALQVGQRGLEKILAGSPALAQPFATDEFASRLLEQLLSLAGVRDGLVCAVKSRLEDAAILAVAGRFAGAAGHTLADLSDSRLPALLARALAQGGVFSGREIVLHLPAGEGVALLALAELARMPEDIERRLLEVFGASAAICLENARLYQRTYEQAFEDGLLGIPNRNGFLLRVDQRRAGENVLALVDLDNFSEINSILDQSFGDAVLQAVGQRLRAVLGPEVVLARVGSDIFGLLGTLAQLNPDRLNAALTEAFEVAGQSLRISATSSLLEIPPGAPRAVELLKNASVTLKAAKLSCRGQLLRYDPAHAERARERMQLLTQLRADFQAGRLFLMYQPFVDFSSRRIVGAEALLRWQQADGCFVSPERFIPLAEQSGLIVAIGEMILREALSFARDISAHAPVAFRMAINISHIQFREPDFVERLIATVHEFGVDPRQVEIELTESVAVENLDTLEQKLSAIRAAGLAIAVDDFGTGYSSLGILGRLPVDRLKIDRAFVSGDGARNDDYRLAGVIQQLAQVLGLGTIAEGIETEVQCRRLFALGCREGQGFLFARPLPAADFLRHVQTHGFSIPRVRP